MKNPLHRTSFTIFGVLFLAFLFMSYGGNAPQGYTGAPGEGTCSGCHSGNSLGMTGDIQITGVPGSISPNTTYPLSVIVSNPDGISLTAGFSMLVLGANSSAGSVGTLSNPSTSSAIATGFKEYFVHSPAQSYDGNRLSTWTVDWTSPAAATNEVITFYGVGNITDNNAGSNTGSDFVVTTTASGTISGTPTGSDLTVSNLVGWNATYAPGDVVYFDFDINNIGNAMVNGDYSVTSYLSTDPVFDASDISVGDLVTGNTGVGTIPSVVGAISIPANLSPGNYYLIIVIDALFEIAELDENNNILVSSIASSVQSSVPLVASWNVSNTTCNGSNDGTATAVTSGGATPYMYAWQNGMTTNSISGLAAGSYPFTVTDAVGNTVNDIAIVNEPSALIATVATAGVQCASDALGSANVTIGGGSVPYTTLWPSGNNTTLTAGNYAVTIEDNNGCTVIESFSIIANDNTAPTPSVLTLLNGVLDANNQYIIQDPSVVDAGSFDNCGGPLSFSVSPTSFDCTDIGIQDLFVTVTDDSGNSETALSQISITDTTAPGITCPATFTVDCDGVVNYAFPVVTDNCTSNVIPTLVAGLSSGSTFPQGITLVTFEAVDNSGNMSACSLEVMVNGNNLINTTSATNVSCYGVADGTASVVITGGVGPYTYSWSNMETTSIISNLASGTYFVSVVDANGCEATNSVEIVQPSEIIVNIDLVQDDTGSNNGSIFITASGGASGYTYNWTDANGVVVSTSEDPQNLIGGIYSVIVTDAAGCTGSLLQAQVNTMVSIEEISFENAIHIFPNPTTGQLNIDVDINLKKAVTLQIFDQSGKLVFDNGQVDISNQVVDLETLKNGLYWCKFIVENKVVIRKVVLAK